MRNGKYTARRTTGTKAFTLMLALILVVGCVAGGTLAWLTATSEAVTNTFSVGDINITLKEHNLQTDGTLGTTEVQANDTYKIVPGSTQPKDPFVTVNANSEKCWLFIRIVETNNTMTVGENTEKLVNYAVADGWTAVPEHAGYYYRVVDAAATDTTMNVFAGNTAYANGCVTYNENITKGQVTANNKPVIKITAAAIQHDNIADVATAFDKLPAEFKA